jgi:glycosyltransferase involved in cell wall biosynthesis
VHHAVQDRVCEPTEPQWLHRRVVAVKAAEIDLADHVLTVSEMARAGYLEAGVAPERVHAVPLGADTRLFSPGAGADEGRFRFLFVGTTIFRKGIDVLLEAFRAVEQKLPGKAGLVVVGPRGDAHALLESTARGGVAVRGPVPQAELLSSFRSAHCLVLPSRHDSFGMAVVEAMACGLPAIVSDMVGAREAIDEGANGWVVPSGDASALAARMTWCVENRAAVQAMRPKARAAAERYTWDRYAERLGDVLTRVLAAQR